jgi:hypothetical protein
MQTTPDPGALANRRLRLALTSLLLSLAPLAAFGLSRLEALIIMSSLPVPGAVFSVLSVVLYAGSIIGSVGAVVTGARALRRDQLQAPLQPVVRAAAGAGVVLGIAGILLLVFAGVSLALILHECSIDPAACG